jgi:DNA mismatch repair protein MutL
VPKIQLLSDPLISKIAAGEVVERPASVVKELVENALDAGATQVEVELEAGGKRRVAVIDDGSGMAPDDALLAFDRHATSKILTFDDLERVATLGFRGEALATIAAVARVEMLTAGSSGPDAGDGYRVRIEGGRVKVAEPAARPRGTTLEVASLFFNVPARRKFLKSPQTELRRCVEVVQGYALACHNTRFTVRHEGRTLLEALPVGEGLEGVRERIGQIFGSTFAQDLVAIPEDDLRSPDEGGRIYGFLGKPGSHRGRRLFTFVNRRLLRDRAMLATFYRAVREETKSDNYPPLFLFLEPPPEDVDVNVHPQKAEVRFRDPRLLDRLFTVLRRAVEASLGEVEAPLKAPSWERPIAPFAWQGLGERKRPLPPGANYPALPRGTQGELDLRQRPPEPSLMDPGAYPPVGFPPPGSMGPGESSAPGSPGSPGSPLASPTYAPLAHRSPVPLSGRSGEARPFRLLGQYKGTLILLEGPDGLYLIDQHVAHERILYERLRRDLAARTAEHGTPSQALLEPRLLDLGPVEAMRLTELAPALDDHGFGVAPLSGGDVAVTAVPQALKLEQAEKLLRALAASDGDGAVEAMAERLLEALAASLSCRTAIKMHHPLTAEEMESLVIELFAAENPFACPHGRPIVLQMSDADLERRFGRR